MEYENKLKSKEELKRDAKLVSGPSTPDFDDIKISDDLIQRLKNGGKQHANSDNYWSRKLACISEEHTDNLNLTLENIDSNMKDILHHLESTERKKKYSLNREILTQCFESHKNHPIFCSEEVKEFIEVVDKLMFEAVRKDANSSTSNRRLTYAERFKRSFR